MMYRKTCVTIVLAAATIGAVSFGCSSKAKEGSETSKQKKVKEDFFATPTTRPVVAFMNAQTRAGARYDATLYARHFDGNELNALGRAKLDLMTARAGEQMTTLYLNFGEHDGMDGRRDTVVAYLRENGLDENNFKFVSGPNTTQVSPAGAHLERMKRTESEGGFSSEAAGMK